MAGVNCFGQKRPAFFAAPHRRDRILAHFKRAIFKTFFLVAAQYLRLPLQPADLKKHL